MGFRFRVFGLYSLGLRASGYVCGGLMISVIHSDCRFRSFRRPRLYRALEMEGFGILGFRFRVLGLYSLRA